VLYELLRLQPSVVKCGFLSVNWQIIGKSYAALDDVKWRHQLSKNSAIAGAVVFCFIHAFHRNIYSMTLLAPLSALNRHRFP
jgi:hypothetical protein